MIQNQTLDHTSTTANADRTTFARKTAPLSWWRAVDQFTLTTMNAPIPARVRAATDSTDTGYNDSDNDDTVTTYFAAAIRAAAPGRSERSTRSDAPVQSGFAAGIRAAAPGRRS